MFTRSSQPGRDVPAPDPLPVRLAAAAVVLSLIASGVAVIWGDLATRGGVLLPGTAAGGPGTGTVARRPLLPVAAAGGLSGRHPAGPAVRLLNAAAVACRVLAYHGVVVSVYQGADGAVTSVVEVWHQSGGQALVRPAGAAAAPALAPVRAGHAVVGPDLRSATDDAGDERDAGGGVDMTPQLVALLAANYRVSLGGQALVAGRTAEEVVLRGRNGAVAARFWVDRATNLPLRREVFAANTQLVSDDAFLSVTLGDAGAAAAPAASQVPRSLPLNPRQLARLRAGGWPVPARLPGRLTLVQARETHQAGGAARAVVDLAYSDGLSVVSLFLQRGHLPARLPGWSRVAVQGQYVFAAGPGQRSMAWSARGFVLTVIADAPEATVDRVVAALPHSARPGFLGRMCHGLGLLASWLNPFR